MTNKIFVTGDTHGDFSRLQNHSTLVNSQYLIIAGDFGGIWTTSQSQSQKEKENLSLLDSLPFTTLWVAGNHENYDRLGHYYGGETKVGEFPITELWGSPVQCITSKCYRLLDGQIYNSPVGKILTIGGATSIDKHLRIPGLSWWPAETLTPHIMDVTAERLFTNNFGHAIDHIITHCAPRRIAEKIIGPNKLYCPMEDFFNIIDNLTPNKSQWVFGHYHTNELFEEIYQCLYEDIIELKKI